MAEMVRVNTRISATLNEWLDKRSEETGVPKSTIIFLALEQYRQQTEVFDKLTVYKDLLEKMEQVEALERLKKLKGE